MAGISEEEILNFDRYIDSIEEKLCTLGNVQTKAIDYGVQIILNGTAKKVTLNVYNGKKGVKAVWGGGDLVLQEQASALLKGVLPENGSAPETPLPEKSAACPPVMPPVKRKTPGKNRERVKRQQVPGAGESVPEEKVVSATTNKMAGTAPAVPRTQSHSSSAGILLAQEPGFDGVWLGSDESGKGDYFGPLVVAAVCLDRGGAEKLIASGVKDCKALADKKILALAELIEKNALASSVLIMKPQAYNMRYEQVKRAAGTLNVLLSYGHVAALRQALQKYPACRWAIVDQFAKNDRITPGIREFCPDMQVIQRPRAEEDIAVAAASVLARAAFVRTMEQLAAEAGVEKLPKGGGEAATRLAQKLAREQGREALSHFVKLHFANTRKIPITTAGNV